MSVLCPRSRWCCHCSLLVSCAAIVDTGFPICYINIMTEGRRFDIISDLKQKPFSRRSEAERFKILTDGRPKVSISLVKPDGCGKTRRFSKVWYNKADWLCGSSERQALFCWPCTLLSTKSSPWSSMGFTDLKKISKRGAWACCMYGSYSL